MAMNETKRHFFKTLGAFGLIAFNPLLSTQAQAMKTLMQSYNDAMTSNFGDKNIDFDSSRINIKAPNHAENGSSVPIKSNIKNLADDEYMTKAWYVVNENKRPFAIEFNFTEATGFGDIGTQLRFSKKSKITIIYQNNKNELFASAKNITVINGGCGISKDKIVKKP